MRMTDSYTVWLAKSPLSNMSVPHHLATGTTLSCYSVMWNVINLQIVLDLRTEAKDQVRLIDDSVRCIFVWLGIEDGTRCPHELN